MDHVAILRKARISKGDNLLGDILEGTKTIESRWYVNKVSPWDVVKKGDTVYFKESGCPVTAKASVSKVLQYTYLNEEIIVNIVKEYGTKIAPHTKYEDFVSWIKTQYNKRFCILVFLENVVIVTPFEIDKKGFGISSAWLAVGDIAKVRLDKVGNVDKAVKVV